MTTMNILQAVLGFVDQIPAIIGDIVSLFCGS